MMFFPILLLFIILYLLFKDNISINGSKRDNANEILDMRLAKGEISIDEYKKLKAAKDEK